MLTVRKGFWASPESEAFPHRVFVPTPFGYSTSLANMLLGAGRGLWAFLRHRPRLLLIGSAHRLVPPLLFLRRLGLLRRTGLVVTNRVFFGPRFGRFADRVIVYSSRETEGRRNYAYVPIPVGDLSWVVPEAAPEPYVFSGGGGAARLRVPVCGGRGHRPPAYGRDALARDSRGRRSAPGGLPCSGACPRSTASSR